MLLLLLLFVSRKNNLIIAGTKRESVVHRTTMTFPLFQDVFDQAEGGLVGYGGGSNNFLLCLFDNDMDM